MGQDKAMGNDLPSINTCELKCCLCWSVLGSCGLAVSLSLILPRPFAHGRCVASHSLYPPPPYQSLVMVQWVVWNNPWNPPHAAMRRYRLRTTTRHSIQSQKTVTTAERDLIFPVGSHESCGMVLSVLLMSDYSGHHHRPGRRRQSRPAGNLLGRPLACLPPWAGLKLFQIPVWIARSEMGNASAAYRIRQ